MSHWLVTGGAGFIGSHLAEALLARGEGVVVLDDLSTGRTGNLPAGAALRRGSIRDEAAVAGALAGARGVFHLAAVVSVEASLRDLLPTHRVNLEGTLVVLDAARRAGNLPVVLASSAAVYGDQGARDCVEDGPARPISPYGADKLAAEHHAAAFWAVHGLPTAGLRFFNVYGPRQDPTSPYAGVIPRFLGNLAAGRPHAILGDGRQTRDFVHVDDVVRAMLAAQALLAREPQAALANVCTGRATPLLDLAAAVDRLRPFSVAPPRHEPARAGDIRHSRGSPARMRSLLGVEAAVTLEDGLRGLLHEVPDLPLPAVP